MNHIITPELLGIRVRVGCPRIHAPGLLDRGSQVQIAWLANYYWQGVNVPVCRHRPLFGRLTVEVSVRQWICGHCYEILAAHAPLSMSNTPRSAGVAKRSLADEPL